MLLKGGAKVLLVGRDKSKGLRIAESCGELKKNIGFMATDVSLCPTLIE